MKFLIVFLLFLNFNFFVKAQSNVEFFPNNLTVQPFTANILEPKVGFLFHLSENELRLDIGNSIDILRIKKGDEWFSFGADLFTYTLLRSEENFRFPVDAVDYLFGFNFTYKKFFEKKEYGFRARLSHISAHLVDGRYDWQKNGWRDGLNPRVYSREFFELMSFYKSGGLRIYCGFAYLFNVKPVSIKKDNYQIGFDYFLPNFIYTNFSPFIGYDLKLIHLDKYTANHSLSAGIKFGKPEAKGLSVYLNFYSGKSIHGEYFDLNKEYTAVGINMDL